MLQEFKKFISRGNVIDLAVAVIIGGAFGRIVTSLVDDVLMPVLGIIAGGVNLTALKVVIKEAQGETAELALHYGMFLQTVIDFLIVAFAIFIIIKLINSFKKKEDKKPEAPPAPSKEVVLLEEIRDILREK
ncbi:MAG: large-conductance mechanosensitive channel protein MscL [Firmicutes bacterium]|nr:large-conductance mechanosensitive channel protein MscL [Bacillota bacterium]